MHNRHEKLLPCLYYIDFCLNFDKRHHVDKFTCVSIFCRIVPNCVTKAKNVRTRIFVGDQIDECKDLSGLYYLLPFQKVSQESCL